MGNYYSGMMQSFVDTRFGNTATIRIDLYADLPFVLRVRDRYGHLNFISHYKTAKEAKYALEKITDACNPGWLCNWYTVKGNVCDIDPN